MSVFAYACIAFGSVLVICEIIRHVRARRRKARAAEQLADTAASIPFDRILERTGERHALRKRQLPGRA